MQFRWQWNGTVVFDLNKSNEKINKISCLMESEIRKTTLTSKCGTDFVKNKNKNSAQKFIILRSIIAI